MLYIPEVGRAFMGALISNKLFPRLLPLLLWSGVGNAAPVVGEETLGFAVYSFYTAVHETKYMDECPRGLAIGNDEIWWKGLDPKVRDELTDGGEIEPVTYSRRAMSVLRGPNGEDVCWNPEVVKDPPLKTVQGNVSFGMDLDGSAGGSGAANSCPHENFISPTGDPGIDNQMYRLLGCVYGWRENGYVESNANGELRDTSQGLILIEVSGVNNRRNDDEVTVSFYRGGDELPKDSRTKILPYASYRIHDVPGYGVSARGKIVDGVLHTESVDASLPNYGNLSHHDIHLKGMRLRLNINEDSGRVKGMFAGYRDFDNFWHSFRKLEFLHVTGQFSCPGVYAAANELLDGYPDPVTGKCTALSSAYNIEAVSAFVIHANEGDSI
jgi:hypothetical protein